MRVRTVALLAVLTVASGLVVAWRYGAVREAEREAAAETSQVRTWARANAAVGVSVLPKRVPAADPADIRRLQDEPGFHAFAMRCSSCHELPDPGAYDARRWIGKVDEMQEHIRRSGTVPPPDSVMREVVEFLGEASESLRR